MPCNIERNDDDGFDVIMAVKYYVLTNIHKKWGSGEIFTTKIKRVIFRGNNPWTRMDVLFVDGKNETCANVFEFIEHYHPKGVDYFDANKMFVKQEQLYGVEYSIDIY